MVCEVLNWLLGPLSTCECSKLMNFQVKLKFGGTCPAKSHLFMEVIATLLFPLFAIFLGTSENASDI
jgi:hypothetical protein